MNKFSLAVLTLALSVGVVSGCSEKKQPAEKAMDTAAPAAVSVSAEPAVKEAAPVAKVVVKPVAVKAPATPAASGVPMKLAAERKVQATADTVQKAAAEKAAATVTVVETTTKTVETKVKTTVAAAEKAVETPAAAAGDAQAGAAIFKTKCSPCHGADGKGTTMAPALKANSWIKGASNGEISDVIKNGRVGKAKKYKNFFVDMPANKGLAEKDMNDLVGYLRSIN